MQADAQDKARKVLAELRKTRDGFRDAIKKQTGANEAAWTGAKTRLETEWSAFEAEVKKYVKSYGKQFELQQATFKLQAAAQLKAWRDAADKLASAASEFASGRRNEIETNREPHEGRCVRLGGKAPEAEPGRKPVMVRPYGSLDGNARCLRSRQSNGVGGVQAGPPKSRQPAQLRRDRGVAIFAYRLRSDATTRVDLAQSALRRKPLA